MIYEDEFIYFFEQMKKHPKQPYIFANPELAEDFYIRLRRELPNVSKHDLGFQSFICITPEARKKVIKNFKTRIKAKQKDIFEIERAIKDVEISIDLVDGRGDNESNID